MLRTLVEICAAIVIVAQIVQTRNYKSLAKLYRPQISRLNRRLDDDGLLRIRVYRNPDIQHGAKGFNILDTTVGELREVAEENAINPLYSNRIDTAYGAITIVFGEDNQNAKG